LVDLTNLLVERRAVILQRLTDREATLREDFAHLDVLGKAPGYDACAATVRRLLGPPGKSPRRKQSARR
jgi:hypothetical protein